MKILHLTLIVFLFITVFCFAQSKDLLLDGFENRISGGPDGTVDFGSGGDSSIEVAASTDIKYSGQQSIKLTYNAAPGGYMWAARGFGLDAKNTAWQVLPKDIQWDKYNGISFYMYGSGTNAKIAFDIKDDGNEMWRFILEDSFQGWKRIICPFDKFFARGDWQPDNADKNATLNFPVKSFQFEPLPQAKGTVYFDDVELVSS